MLAQGGRGRVCLAPDLDTDFRTWTKAPPFPGFTVFILRTCGDEHENWNKTHRNQARQVLYHSATLTTHSVLSISSKSRTRTLLALLVLVLMQLAPDHAASRAKGGDTWAPRQAQQAARLATCMPLHGTNFARVCNTDRVTWRLSARDSSGTTRQNRIPQ